MPVKRRFIHRQVLALNVVMLLCIASTVSAATKQYMQLPPVGTTTVPRDAQIIPNQFLRSWDPVTIFFDHDVGPDHPRAEDHPQRFVTVKPQHPGAFTWINSRTLQFRPAEPWPPLTKFSWHLKKGWSENRDHTLFTLMSSPHSTTPENGASGLDPIDTISLTFDEPLDVNALANMISIELRVLPGVGDNKPHWLDKKDFQIKISDRSRRGDPVQYVLLLNQPIAGGQQAIVHLRLSLDDSVEQSFENIRFSTAEPFHILRFGCASNRYPATPDGVQYTKEQAIQCNSQNREIQVEFSAPPQIINLVQARNLVRFIPSVKDLQFSQYGNTLSVRGKFSTNTLYQLNLTPSPLTDAKKRPLQMSGDSGVFVYFPPQHSFLEWEASQGIVERYGPQMVPIKGRGHDRLDLRIYTVKPLDRSFWPFPQQPVSVDEQQRPPGPGERPEPYRDASRYISSPELRDQIRSLGSPAYSHIVNIPLQRNGSSAKFGLSLKKAFATIAGSDKPGSYLVGLRRLDDSTTRSWIRVQVTDLSLTTVEERAGVKFVVTSLKTGKPLNHATIRVEGEQNNEWITVVRGKTDSDGSFYWHVPGYHYPQRRINIRRIVVQKDDDVLVLDPTQSPDKYSDNVWSNNSDNGGETWLQWTVESLDERKAQKETLCHLFSDRPMYKPADVVHIKGYIRNRLKGKFSLVHPNAQLVVTGPGDREWRYKVKVNKAGSIYHTFKEEKLPTGSYSAYLELKDIGPCGSLEFQKESYRIPRFEVQLHGPDKVPLDKKFNITMTAKYYAGGQVVEQPIRWRVTQFPYTWTPKKRKGFLYSSDARFSRRQAFRSSPVLNLESKTDANGSAVLTLDPAIEPTAQPRSYVIETTVTGADDQTVTNTKRVYALPPLVLGIKAPRYLPKATSINPEIIAVGPDGQLLAGQAITLRLIKRQWHSHLQAADFSQAATKYVTEVVDETILEKTIHTQSQPLKEKLPIQSAGVYIIELESHDQLGRAQIVSVDLYAGGAEPVTWSKPPTEVFTVTSDKANYVPGESAQLILESPYQNARALAIIEAPDKNYYSWVPVHGGAATFTLPISKTYTPRVPVHFVLMRGRIGDKEPSLDQLDLGKPTTVAATHWLDVKPVEHMIDLKVDMPKRVLPGAEVTAQIQLQDNHGKPLAGEVTLWLVDQAVLALAKEKRLEILPDFITNPQSTLSVRDTRNLAFGHLPFEEQPGGGEAAAMAEASQLIDKVTVRKNFKTVPYYNPAIKVDDSGRATVKIKMPDNLTNFKLRAKAVSGTGRFGIAKGSIAVRLPVIVQPALPRFVRPGDQFTATAIGRVVEGDGGKGIATIKTEGLQLQGNAIRQFNWDKVKPHRLDFQVNVPTPIYNAKGEISNKKVTFACAVERKHDKARDAFKITVPVKPDRYVVIKRQIQNLSAGQRFTLAAVNEPVRNGTFKRSLLLSNQPGLIRMAGGLNYLMEYPFGCTEQRISRARAFMASKQFRQLIDDRYNQQEADRVVTQTLHWLDGVIDSNDLVGYWPGSQGYVSLTAWVVEFMLQARDAGYPVNTELLKKLTHSLEQSLRSDYRYFIDGEAYTERTMALWALSAAGKSNPDYAAELARKANYLNLESLAMVMRVLNKDVGQSADPAIAELTKRLWEGLVFRLYRGKEIYGGLQETAVAENALVLPSETRTLAEVVDTLQLTANSQSRLQTLVNGLTTLGKKDGWGSTNANASALMALNQYMLPQREQGSDEPSAQQDLLVNLDGTGKNMHLSESRRLLKAVSTKMDGGFVQYTAGDKSVIVREETRYIPQADGSHVRPLAQGFVVNRELFQVKPGDQPMQRIALDKPAMAIALKVGDVIEDHVQVVNAVDRTYVAVVIPLAAGLEILNPHLATAPPEAHPKGMLTLTPSYAAYLDDQVAFYYDKLPKGNYDFYFRTRASIPGNFVQPAAFAQMMYRDAVNGNSSGARIEIKANDTTDEGRTH